MEIKRDIYLQRLIARKHNGLIKVITGIRRCGKSYLLFKLFKKHLLQTGVDAQHIIDIVLDDPENTSFYTGNTLYNYIKSKITDHRTYYILLDEVQYVEKFELILNGLLHIENVDIYVTGSNSKFLSSDIVTEFRGRGDEVHIYPLSFAEYVSAYEGSETEAWKEYYTYGGLPSILSMQDDEQKSNYLYGQFQNVYLKDIIERHRLQHVEELDELLNILSSDVGSYTNPAKLSQTFKSVKHVDISPITLSKYLKILQESFLISQALRYDVKGKRYINTPAKFYFEDAGLRNVRLNFRQNEENHLMENIVYNELRMRGFRVDVGVVEILDKVDTGRYLRKQLEVDFVANLGSKRYYIQSAFRMPDPAKQQQEERPLIKINDSFKKIILIGDDIKLRRDDYGIVTMGIREFLLNPHSLEL
ncbi:MAG: ATP-binding protein [Elusimicrobiaceae bacterium]|nr:ATP-binding protein [Elusimicrobiaceae bacterium]